MTCVDENAKIEFEKNEEDALSMQSDKAECVTDEIVTDESDMDRILRQKEDARIRAKRLRRRLIPVFAVLLAVLILVPLLITLISNLGEDEPIYELVPIPDYDFYPVYDGDILSYDRYLGCNRELYYYDNPLGYGERYTVRSDETDLKLQLVYAYLQTIIHGNADAYNAFFNGNYYREHERQAAFAQQMIYDINLYADSSKTEYLENGEKLYTYRLDYMILYNNGTFRRDIGSDMVRSQILVLREHRDGSVSIENLSIVRQVVQVNK